MNWLREANSEPITGYRLIEPLGSGGFGEVWKCEAPGGLFKAIKFVYGNMNSVDNDAVRADQEFKALQRIKEVRHPFVCSVERIDHVDGELIIVMELADRTLHDVYQECQAAGQIGIPAEDVLRYLRDAGEALDYMFEKHNLQHLDVKPRNLFLIGDRVKVADFGLVKTLERAGASGILGGVTPMYAPPETFVGKVSQHSDQYSLAIVYQEMLTGQRPYLAKNIRQMAQMHLQGEPDLRALPEAERPVVARALAKDPNKRYPSKTFVAALYKARSAARANELGGRGSRKNTKTIADTMEDMILQGIDPSVALGLEQTPVSVRSGLAAAADALDVNEDGNPVEVGDLGMTVMQPENGALKPTLIIGVGTFGRKAILELRCRFLDRFGDLGKLPLLRFLYLDPDPDAKDTAFRGAPEVALTRNEYYPLPLQPVGNYRRRSLDQLSEWLPREKLYAMPRSLKTEGCRALGRLAFSDNQQRLLARLRREVQEITNSDNIYQAVTKTGLALSNNTPRVYVLAAAGGGGSGLLPDLGYALRRLLATLRHPDAQVTTFLACGAPTDPATPKPELANVYATLTELNHYSDPEVPFAAQYGADGQRLVDQGPPFDSVYLLPLAHRSPDALDESIAHLGSYLFHEMTTPLGLRLEELRFRDRAAVADQPVGTPAIPMRSFGTYAVWFPRGLLLHLAARQACKRLIDTWTAADLVGLPPEVQQATARVVQHYTQDSALNVSNLVKRIDETTQAGSVADTGSAPGEVLAGLLAKLEEQIVQSVALDDPGNWARQAATRVRDWVGGVEAEAELGEWRKTRLARLLGSSAQKLAEEWEQKVSADLFGLMQFPGARVAAAEHALDQLRQLFLQLADGQQEALALQATKSAQAWRQVESALKECVSGSGGFRLFGGRSKSRQLRHFMDQIAHYAHARLAEELLAAARHGYLNLAGRLDERGRDLGFCRQRLRHLHEGLENGLSDPNDELADTRPTGDHTMGRSPLPSPDNFWEAIRQSATARVVLPDGQHDLQQAALRFLQGLPADLWLQLDKDLYEQVLQPQGGLHGLCTSGDLTRQLAIPLLEDAAKFLGQHLPIMDVAQILHGEVRGAGGEEDVDELKAQTADYLKRAAPLFAGKDPNRVREFLLIPASPAGKALGEAVQAQFPELNLVRVPGQSDLMILREQGSLTMTDVETLFRLSRTAYQTLATAPTTSPHARFDLTDWLPLDP